MKTTPTLPPPNPAAKSAAGFTRLELLVSLGVGALLGALALADLGAGGESARRLQCLDNLRRLIAASHFYATESLDRLPHPTWGTVSGSSAAGPSGWAYATYLPESGWIRSLNGRTDVSPQIPYLRAGQLWPFIRDEETFLCPEDVVASLSGNFRSLWRQRDVKVTSFMMNGAVISYGNLQYSGTSLPPGSSGRTHPLSSFAPAAFLFWEADPVNPFNFGDAGAQPREGLASRHGPGPGGTTRSTSSAAGAHVGCFDGSARYLTQKEFADEAGGIVGGNLFTPQALPNRSWCAPDSPNGGFSF